MPSPSLFPPRPHTISLLLIVHSVQGLTLQLAQAVERGFRRSAGSRAQVQLLELDGADVIGGRFNNEALLEAADRAAVLLFAAPTYMGGPSAQFKAFADASSPRWSERRWQGKLAAGLTSGGSPNGEQSMTLQYFQVLAAQHGMAWVPPALIRDGDPQGRNRLGSALGLCATAEADGVPLASDLATAEAFGDTLATWAARLPPARASVAEAGRPDPVVPRVQGFDHLHVEVRDRGAAVAWYGRVMGLHVCEPLRHWAVDGGPLTLGDAQDQVHLALFERASPSPSNVLALRVDAVGFVQWQHHLNRELGQDLAPVDHGLSQSLYFRDPDGNGYEITTYEVDALPVSG
jgi:NAD(P)H dehydrogenase (quinone)